MEIYKSNTGSTAYKIVKGNSKCGIFYLPGHRNTLKEHKGALIEDICNEQGISMTHWAYYGWDKSTSEQISQNGDGYIRDWLSQALDVFDNLTSGPQVIVGYSMGGYLALALALARPERVRAIIGLASGFGESLCLQSQGIYGSFDVLDKNGAGFQIQTKKDGSLPILSSLKIDCPIYLYHSLEDYSVSWKNCLEISKAVSSKDVFITLAKTAEHPHRLNQPEDIRWLKQTLINLSS